MSIRSHTPGTGPGDADALDPIVHRIGEEEVEIRWRGAPPGPVAVSAGTAPDKVHTPVAVADLARESAYLRGYPRSVRHYFELRADRGGAAAKVAERRLPLAGQPNFRDLGGYATADGRRVRWGRLFRSGMLAELDDHDIALLGTLSLELICDFRTTDERAESPHRLSEERPPRQAALASDDLPGALDPSEIRSRISSGDFAGIEIENLLVAGNSAFATTHRAPFRRLLALAADTRNHPLLVNCTAGKDRAGFAAAVLLLALGVRRETIRADYLLSAPYRIASVEETLTRVSRHSSSGFDLQSIRPLLEARPEYISAAFTAIDETWGSDEAFLRDGLNFTKLQETTLRDALLE